MKIIHLIAHLHTDMEGNTHWRILSESGQRWYDPKEALKQHEGSAVYIIETSNQFTKDAFDAILNLLDSSSPYVELSVKYVTIPTDLTLTTRPTQDPDDAMGWFFDLRFGVLGTGVKNAVGDLSGGDIHEALGPLVSPYEITKHRANRK